MFINTTANLLSSFFSSSFDSNSVVGHLASAVSGNVKSSLQVARTDSVFSTLQKDEFISSTSGSDSSNSVTDLTYGSLQLKRKANLESHSVQTFEPVTDEASTVALKDYVNSDSLPPSAFVQSKLSDSISTESSRNRYNTVDMFIERNNSEIRYNDFVRFVTDKTDEQVANGENVSFVLPTNGRGYFKSAALLKGLETERLALDKYGKPKIPNVNSDKVSATNSTTENTKNEELLPPILITDLALTKEQAESLERNLNAGICNGGKYDTTEFNKWQKDYYDYLESSGRTFYSDISQVEEQVKHGNKIDVFTGIDSINKRYTVGIVSYGNGEITQPTSDNYKSKITVPIMDKLTANGITLDNKEGFTVNVGVDGTVKLGESNIKGETKIAAIKQALESDETLGQQLVNTCRNDSLFGILACI